MGRDILSCAWWRGFAGRWGRRLWGVRGWNRLMLNGGTGCGWWGRRKRRGRRLLILVVAVLVIRIILLGIVGAVGGRVAHRRGCTVPNGEGGKCQRMRHTLLQSLPVSSHKLTDFGTSRRNLINTREDSARSRDSAKFTTPLALYCCGVQFLYKVIWYFKLYFRACICRW